MCHKKGRKLGLKQEQEHNHERVIPIVYLLIFTSKFLVEDSEANEANFIYKLES